MQVDAQETGAPLPAERPHVVAPTSAATDPYSLPRRVAPGHVDAIERVSTDGALRPVAFIACRRRVEACVAFGILFLPASGGLEDSKDLLVGEAFPIHEDTSTSG